MRTLARALSCAAPIVLVLTLAAAQPAAAKVASVHPVQVTGTAAVFKLHKVDPASVRSAAVRLGHKKRGLSVSKIRSAARRNGRLRVRLPRSWRRALRRNAAAPKLVVKTATLRRPAAPKTSRRPVPAPKPKPAPTRPPAPAPAPTPSPAPADPAPAASITGRTFYVSPNGADSNSGSSPQAAWRTVARVNRAGLAPGDGVLFQGGATFSDDVLMPARSGTDGRPLVFGSYGNGQATFTQGAWFMSKSWLTFDNLRFTGSNQGIAGSGNGTGSASIVVQNSTFDHLGIAVNAPGHADRDWTLRSNHVDGTGDSGFILLGDGHVVSGNSILHTGTDSSIPYGKHGIYLKSSNSRVVGNTILYFQGNGVSTRFHNATIENNVISDGQAGIAWFQNDDQGGTSHWRNNSISGTTAACLYVSPSDTGGSTRESFVISGNRLARQSGPYTDFQHTSGTYSLLSNLNL